ncbi:E3 ubiquitin-protein ligase mind-bomb [Geodia barretti]|uniref:E3 ubiquitin-protein ligase mind-bomb n=1 Tax=Geodia barretti TaxID=519541 RepID=A0AA35S4J9_GEOBA|nr:E3 ubiquitin-protein ligase mind-bomb [Geodia barretti]
MEAALGQRVVRGPDWEWGDQDGGEGFVGTVAGLEEGGGGVIVQWDMGQRCRYRCGRDNKFDLRVLDDGPSGRSYSKHRCHVCRKKRVYGVMWRCLHCPEYYLCSVCYLANHHCSLHRFTCLLDRDGMQFRVLARADSRRIPVSGLFYGAEVVRGTDWRWNDQDGGVGRTGKVVEVLDWSNEGGSGYERSVVLVTWENGNKKKYRAGHRGKVDVRCIAPGSGGFYYPEHLPVLCESNLQKKGPCETSLASCSEPAPGTIICIFPNCCPTGWLALPRILERPA